MFARTHKTITGLAFDLASRLPEFKIARGKRKEIVAESAAANEYEDLEFVKVEGGLLGSGRDDPHKMEYLKRDDYPHYETRGVHLTRFNHFIDVRKGAGEFDDFDGYSYRKGSARKGEHQTFSKSKVHYYGKLPSEVPASTTIDAGISWYLGDQYVHAPGMKWYKQCSPAVERYSYRNTKTYKTISAESKERFPLAVALNEKRCGVPYSVFLPVDNMARYWFDVHTKWGKPAALGACLHAVQDAGVPHHAAGTWGNWHGEWERDLDAHIAAWSKDKKFVEQVRSLFDVWNRTDALRPLSLTMRNRMSSPAANWRADTLVTWLALQSFHEYRHAYGEFKKGYKWQAAVVKDLAAKTTAVSLLVLAKAGKR